MKTQTTVTLATSALAGIVVTLGLHYVQAESIGGTPTPAKATPAPFTPFVAATPWRATPGVVRSIAGTPPLRDSALIPNGRGERCFFWDEQAQFLILGTEGAHSQFVPDEPPTGNDVKEHGWPISQHHPLYQELHKRPVAHTPTLQELREMEEERKKRRATLRELGMTPPPAGWKRAYPSPSGVMFDVTYDPATDTIKHTIRPNKTEPGKPLIPGEKYYKLNGDLIILGTINDPGVFVPDEKVKPIDTRKGNGMFLHYPFLPETYTKDWKRTTIDKDGNEIESIWDARNQQYREIFHPKK